MKKNLLAGSIVALGAISLVGCSVPSPSSIMDDITSCQIDYDDFITLDESVSYSFDGYEEGLEELGLDPMPNDEDSVVCDGIKSGLKNTLEATSREASIYVDNCVKGKPVTHEEVTSQEIKDICNKLSDTMAVYEELGTYDN